MPFPGTRVFHEGWEAHHQPVAEGTMTATGAVWRHSSTKVFNEVTGKSEYPDPTAVYGEPDRAPMRVVRDGVETTVMIGERQVVKRNYIVTLPAAAPEILVNDEIRVATAGADELLPGESLWVLDPRLGSLIWERDLLCTNVPPANR